MSPQPQATAYAASRGRRERYRARRSDNHRSRCDAAGRQPENQPRAYTPAIAAHTMSIQAGTAGKAIHIRTALAGSGLRASAQIRLGWCSLTDPARSVGNLNVLPAVRRRLIERRVERSHASGDVEKRRVELGGMFARPPRSSIRFVSWIHRRAGRSVVQAGQHS